MAQLLEARSRSDRKLRESSSAKNGLLRLRPAEGNRVARFVDNDTSGTITSGDTAITEYEWDHRNRLTQVTDFDDYADYVAVAPSQVVEYAYDYANRWIGQTVDSDGNGTVDSSRAFVYDGNQIVLDFVKAGTGELTSANLAYRYLWGLNVDELLAQEDVGDAVQWTLSDHLGSVRDLLVYDAATDATSLVNHLVYDAFGNVVEETNPSIAVLLRYTARPLDVATGLQNNLNRWYDAAIGRWLSEDPIGFWGGDVNLYRYVGNAATNLADPSGLSPWEGIGRILGKRWTKDTCERAGKTLATELLQKLASHSPNSQKAQEIIRALKKMGWVEEALGQGSKAGKTLDEGGGIILREMENGNRTGRFLEWYPGQGPHHSDPHWKFSSGESGTLRTCITGTASAVAIAAIPGAAQACEGDWNAAGRDVFVEFTPLTWSKMVWESLGSFFDSCERDLYGDKYHRQMEEYRKEYWDNKRNGCEE